MLVLALMIRGAVIAAATVLRVAVAVPLAGVPLAVLGRAVFVHFKPYRDCRWCKGTGRRKGRRRCWRCKGRRLTRRLGAYHVHKIKLSLLQAWQEWRER